MLLDSARLIPFVIILSVIVGFFNFIVLGSFFPLIFIVIAFALVVHNLFDDGRWAMWGPILMLADVLSMIRVGFDSTLPAAVIFSFVLFLVTIPVFLVVRQEAFHFDRTILSMNGEDRKLARKAMISGKFEDYTKVAKYTDWNAVK